MSQINRKTVFCEWLLLSAGVLLASVVWYVGGFAARQDRAKLELRQQRYAHFCRVEEVKGGVFETDKIAALASMINHAGQNRLRNLDRDQPVQLILVHFSTAELEQLQHILRDRCPGMRFDCKIAESVPESRPEPPYLIVAAEFDRAEIAAGTVPLRRRYQIKTDGALQTVTLESGIDRP